MPLSPSMNVIALLHDAVFMKAGSYVIRPNSSASTLICLRSIARIAVSPSEPGSSTATEYDLPVRPSLISTAPDAESLAPAALPDFAACVVPMLRSPWEYSRAAHRSRVSESTGQIGRAHV